MCWMIKPLTDTFINNDVFLGLISLVLMIFNLFKISFVMVNIFCFYSYLYPYFWILKLLILL